MPETSAYGLARIRCGLVQFAVGRCASAGLGFCAFALTALVLPVADYGAYVTLVAALDLMTALSTLGVDWVAVRFIPEYRAHGSGALLKKFVRSLVVLRAMSLITAAFVAWLVLGVFASYFRIGAWHTAATLYLGVLVSEGLARFLRDHVLDSLLLQAVSQLSLAMRSGTIVAALAYLHLAVSPLSLTHVAMLELAASGAGLAAAVVGMVRYFGRSRQAAAAMGWTPPARCVVTRLAWHSYTSMVVALMYGTQALIMLASRMLGVSGTALFGYARNLTEQVKRYLPASLFVGFIRPPLIARYSANRDSMRLNRHAVLVYKLSMFALAPVFVFFAVFGESCLQSLSAGKYSDAHAYVIGLLLVLVPFSHRQVLEMVVNTLNRPELLSCAARASLVTLPLAALMIAAEGGVWGLIGAVACGEIVSNSVIILGLRRRGIAYRLDSEGLMRIALAVAVAIFFLFGFRNTGAHAVDIGVAAAASLVAFLAAAYFVKPFSATERSTVNRLLTRPLFVW